MGAVGVCFTGGFALAMFADGAVLAPVAAEPSLPLAIGRTRKAAIDLSPADLDTVAARTRNAACALALRFTADFVDELGHPTRDAFDRVLGFLRTRLVPERE